MTVAPGTTVRVARAAVVLTARPRGPQPVLGCPAGVLAVAGITPLRASHVTAADSLLPEPERSAGDHAASVSRGPRRGGTQCAA